MKRYTAEELIAVSCADWHDTIRREVPPEGITAREIVERVDPWEARWLLIRLLVKADRKQLVLWCCDVAQDVRHLITDEETRDAADLAIQTAVAWAEGVASKDDCRAAAYPAYPADDADDANDANDADYDANAACAAYAAYAAADVAAYAADVAAYAVDAAVEAAVSAAAYAANAAAGSADDARKDALRGYLHRLVDRLEGIVPGHAAEKAAPKPEGPRP